MHKPFEPGPRADTIVVIGRWRADPRADELASEGTVVKLEPLKMRLLLALAARPGDVVLTQELLDTVWARLVVTPASVYQGIAQLRRVLGAGDDDAAYIETVPRKGYRLVAPVRHEPRFAGSAAVPDADPGATAGMSAEAAVAAPQAVQVVPPAPSSLPVRRRQLMVAAVASAGAAGAVAWGVSRYLAAQPPELPVRLAVLPFVDRSAGASEPALSQELALDVIRAFERFPQVDVVAAESALLLARGLRDLAETVRRLGVAFLLRGELERTGATVRVVVRLTTAPHERLRWQQEFEQRLDHVAQLPQTIAAEAAAALHLPPAPPTTARAVGPTEAYELYVLGQHAWRAKTPEAFAKARDYFERGIDIDPSFARNYIGLGWTWLGLMTNGGGIDWREGFARATPLFDKALRLEPGSAEALTAQGVLQAQSGRYDEARRLFGEAIRLNPGYAQAHHSRGVAEFDDGWPRRAMNDFRRAAALNPLSLSPLDRLGLACVAAGRWDEAQSAYARAIELEPKHPNGHWGQGILAYAQGSLSDAVAHYRAALAIEPRRPFLWGELGWLYLDLGLADQAADAFGRTAALLPRSRWPQVAAAYAWLLRPDRGSAPAALALPGLPAGEEETIDVMLVRAMAGLPLDSTLLTRAVDARQARSAPMAPSLWFIFQGHDSLLDLAAVYQALQRADLAAPWLAQAQAQLDRYDRQGIVGHALHFHRARLRALQDQGEPSLAALEAAVAAGFRRGWWLQHDPAFARLRDAPRFKAVLTRLAGEADRQRGLLKT